MVKTTTTTGKRLIWDETYTHRGEVSLKVVFFFTNGDPDQRLLTLLLA